MFNKHTFFSLVFFTITTFIHAQADSIFWKNMASETASDLEMTFREHDFKAYAQLNHPKIIEMMGTVDDFATMMEEQMKQIEAEVKIDSIDFGVPFNFKKCETSINCLLPQTLFMRISDTLAMRSTVYLLGISENGGKKWYFVDATNGEQYLDAIVPNRCKIFAIPNKEQEYIRVKKKN